jgi:hypothetical protein
VEAGDCDRAIPGAGSDLASLSTRSGGHEQPHIP